MLRLARFNVELQQAVGGVALDAAAAQEAAEHDAFSGLPSPGAAGTVASLVILHEHLLFRDEPVGEWVVHGAAVAMVAIALLCALAMVSRLRYAHFVNRFRGESVGVGTLALMLVVLGLLLVKPQYSLAGAFTLYALSGPVQWMRGRGRRGDSESMRGEGEAG